MDYSEVCPDCGKDILLGTGGPVNMTYHRSGKACSKARLGQDKQAKLGMQTLFMKNFFKGAPEPKPVHSTMASPLPLVSAPPTGSPAGLPTNPPTSPPPCSPFPLASASATVALTLQKLTIVAAQLPTSVPVAEVEDPVAALCGNPDTIILCLDDDDPYKWLDWKLNNICGTSSAKSVLGFLRSLTCWLI